MKCTLYTVTTLVVSVCTVGKLSQWTTDSHTHKKSRQHDEELGLCCIVRAQVCKSSECRCKTVTQMRSSQGSPHNACTESNCVPNSAIHLRGFPTTNGDKEGNLISFPSQFSLNLKFIHSFILLAM